MLRLHGAEMQGLSHAQVAACARRFLEDRDADVWVFVYCTAYLSALRAFPMRREEFVDYVSACRPRQIAGRPSQDLSMVMSAVQVSKKLLGQLTCIVVSHKHAI